MKLSPQQKKKLSLERDRRNTYGESPHGSRKSIPRRKRIRARGYRHETRQELNALSFRADEELADKVQSDIAVAKLRNHWRKSADTPLAKVIDMNKRMREAHAGRKKRAKAAREKRD